jgi:hypothetical protein
MGYAGDGAPYTLVSGLLTHAYLRSAGVVSLKDLCIKEGKLSWCLFLDVVCLCDDGSVSDAAWLAAVAALMQRKPEGGSLARCFCHIHLARAVRLPALSQLEETAALEASATDDGDETASNAEAAAASLPTIVDGPGTPLAIRGVPIATTVAVRLYLCRSRYVSLSICVHLSVPSGDGRWSL